MKIHCMLKTGKMDKALFRKLVCLSQIFFYGIESDTCANAGFPGRWQQKTFKTKGILFFVSQRRGINVFRLYSGSIIMALEYIHALISIYD